MGEQRVAPWLDHTTDEPGVEPEQGVVAIANADSRDIPVERHELDQALPVHGWHGETLHGDNGASRHSPQPPQPGQGAVRVPVV
jgi:hypothetical protein